MLYSPNTEYAPAPPFLRRKIDRFHDNFPLGDTPYLWSKVICFASFWMMRPPIPPHFMLHSWYLRKALVGVYWHGLRLCEATVWKLLIIEPFSQWKLNKIDTENCDGLWGRSWWCCKAIGDSDLIEFISQFLELRCERYWFLSRFCC